MADLLPARINQLVLLFVAFLDPPPFSPLLSDSINQSHHLLPTKPPTAISPTASVELLEGLQLVDSYNYASLVLVLTLIIASALQSHVVVVACLSGRVVLVIGYSVVAIATGDCAIPNHCISQTFKPAKGLKARL